MFFTFLSAEESEKEKIPVTIEARVSYFWPESQKFRNVYHNGVCDYQLTGTVPVYQGDLFPLRGLNFWWAVDYLESNGQSIGLRNKTSIQIEPLTAGLKWIYPRSFIRPYFGTGLKYYFVQMRNHSPYVKKNINENGPGFVVEAGVQLFLAKYCILDLFLAYSWKQFGSSSSSSPAISTSFDIGGLNIGGGLGVKF